MQENFKMTAKTMYGLEDVLALQIEELGGKNVEKMVRAVGFEGNMKTLYKMNYCLRTALCVLKPILFFTAKNEQELYNNIYKYSWERILDPNGKLWIDASVSGNVFTHSLYVSQKVKDAICDRYRDIFNIRPSVDKQDYDLKIDVHIGEKEVTVSLNSSGESLYKRGYRLSSGVAPLNEVMAAGMIELSSWQKDCSFYDPMCGSGTIAIEAAMYANNIPAQYYRKSFGFEKWKGYRADEFLSVKEEADSKITEFDHEIWASDISQEAVNTAEQNIKNARLHHDINLFRAAMEEAKKPEGKCIVIMNPPYGERLEVDDIVALYERMGDTFKNNYEDCTAYVLSSDIFALKKIGLKPSRKIHVFNGKLECRIFEFKMYSGSKKAKYTDNL